MSILDSSEIRPGIVAYLEESVLRSSDKVAWFCGKGSAHGPPERRPFLCVSAQNHECTWVPITTEPKSGAGYKRLKLISTWRSGGDDACFGNQWIKLNQYLVDGANMYSGHFSEFIDASVNECTTPKSRSLLSNKGIASVLAEIKRQEGRRIIVGAA